MSESPILRQPFPDFAFTISKQSTLHDLIFEIVKNGFEIRFSRRLDYIDIQIFNHEKRVASTVYYKTNELYFFTEVAALWSKIKPQCGECTTPA